MEMELYRKSRIGIGVGVEVTDLSSVVVVFHL
jgi:hypothetical protein